MTEKPLTVNKGDSPDDPPSAPDKHTKKHGAFFDGGAPGQVFRFERWGLSYGTDDKGHAAALVLSFMIAVVLILVFAIGAMFDPRWVSDAIKLIIPILTLTIGVAIGKSSGSK